MRQPVAAVVLGLLLAGCGGDNRAEPERNAAEAAAVPAPPTAAPAPAATDTPAVAEVPEHGTAAAARALVQRYYARIASGDYATARGLWRQNGEGSGMDPQAFARSFAHYARYRATVGEPGRIDAGAGQRYVTVPVEVQETPADGGAAIRQQGKVTLHRSGDIDGATAEQRAWRIERIDLEPVAGEAVEVPETVTARYVCNDGSSFSVAFDNRADTATLRQQGRLLGVLTGQRPGSGIWYAGAGMTLRGKGNQATFTPRDGPATDCTAQE